MTKASILLLMIAVLFAACKKDDIDLEPIIEEPEEPTPPPIINTIPEFYLPALEENYGLVEPELVLKASLQNGLRMPQDLAFHPLRDELWMINRDFPSTGGSVVILYEPGSENQTFQHLRDGNSWHFMAMPTAMAFAENGWFVTTPGVQDANHSGGTFTGPSLWSGHLDTFAQNFGPGTNGSHLDMLHGSPYSMGVAHEEKNVYWVFDGYHKELVRYDFVAPHPPGMHDHSNGKIHRYSDVELIRHSEIPSHMILDKKTGWLYISETENARILRVNIQTGSKSRDLPTSPPQNNEPLAEHWEVLGADWEVFFDENLVHPCGITISDNRLFVTDNSNGDIIAIDLESGEELARLKTGMEGIMGITQDDEKRLWFVSRDRNQLYRIEPK